MQASALQHHDQQLTSIAEGLQEMAGRHERSMESIWEHLQRFSMDDQSPVTAPPPSTQAYSSLASEALVPPPPPGSRHPFLVPSAFPTEHCRMAFIISLLTGKAKDWGPAEWEKDWPACSSVGSFSAELLKVFDHGISP